MTQFTVHDLQKLVPQPQAKALVLALRNRNLGWLTHTTIRGGNRLGSHDRITQILKFDTQECITFYEDFKRGVETDPFRKNTKASLKAVTRNLSILIKVKDL